MSIEKQLEAEIKQVEKYYDDGIITLEKRNRMIADLEREAREEEEGYEY